MKNRLIPQVNFAGVITNLVAVSSRCISFFFLCVRQVERYTLTLDNEKLMFMVALNDGSYLHQTITLVLIFCKTSKNPRTIVCEEKRQPNKTKKKDRQPGQRKRYLAWNIESCCISLCVSAQIQFINGYFSLISLVFVQFGRRAKRC